MKIKGICKGFMCNISQIFVVPKEHEMEIGYPTDVKHVAHIGWDSHSSNAPTWMNEFKSTSDFSDTNNGQLWCSQEFEQSIGHLRQASDNALLRDSMPSDLPRSQTKQKRKKKNKSTLSPKASSSPTSSSFRHVSSRTVSKSKSSLMATTLSELNMTPSVQGLI